MIQNAITLNNIKEEHVNARVSSSGCWNRKLGVWEAKPRPFFWAAYINKMVKNSKINQDKDKLSDVRANLSRVNFSILLSWKWYTTWGQVILTFDYTYYSISLKKFSYMSFILRIFSMMKLAKPDQEESTRTKLLSKELPVYQPAPKVLFFYRIWRVKGTLTPMPLREVHSWDFP